MNISRVTAATIIVERFGGVADTNPACLLPRKMWSRNLFGKLHAKITTSLLFGDIEKWARHMWATVLQVSVMFSSTHLKTGAMDGRVAKTQTLVENKPLCIL